MTQTAGLAQARSEEDVVGWAARTLSRSLSCDRAYLALEHEEAPQWMRQVGLLGKGGSLDGGVVPTARSAVGRVVRTGEILSIPDLVDRNGQKLDELDLGSMAAAGARSVVSIPLVATGQPFGALTLVRRTRQPFSPEEVEELSSTAFAVACVLATLRSEAGRHRAEVHVQTILDNAAEGFALLRSDGRILHTSRVLEGWVGPLPPSRLVWEWFDDGDGYGEQLEVGWSALEHGFMPVETALRRMPGRCARSGGLQLSFRPVLEGEDLGCIVLEVRPLEELEAQESKDALLMALQRFVLDPVSFSDFLEETEAIVQGIVPNQLDRVVLHTLKGNLATMGAAALSRTVHALETPGLEAAESEELVGELNVRWIAYRGAFEEAVGKERRVEVALDRSEYRSFLDEVRASAPELLPRVQAWGLQRARNPMDRLALAARRVADRLDKPQPDIVLEGEDLRLDAERTRPLWSALVHVVRNAVDHGIESPEQRKARGKSPRGQIRLSASVEADKLSIAVADDGAGIDWAAVGEASVELAEADDLRWRLFEPGFSTRTEVTETSGRGLGLAALAAVAEELGGSVDLVTEPGVGTRVSVRVPAVEPKPGPGLVDRLLEDLSNSPTRFGYELPGNLSPVDELELRADVVREQRQATEALQAAMLAVGAHYEAVKVRIDRIREKASGTAQEILALLSEVMNADARESAQVLAMEAAMKMQRADIQEQELANVSGALALVLEYVHGAEHWDRPMEHALNMPFVLETLLPRTDLDHADVPPESGGPEIELF